MEQPRPHRKNSDNNGMRTMNSLFQLRRCQLNTIIDQMIDRKRLSQKGPLLLIQFSLST